MVREFVPSTEYGPTPKQLAVHVLVAAVMTCPITDVSRDTDLIITIAMENRSLYFVIPFDITEQKCRFAAADAKLRDIRQRG